MRKKLLFLVAALLMMTLTAVAQVTTSSIAGQVKTGSEKAIGATVTAKHIPSGTVYRAVTNVNGRYTIQGMRAGGPYEVTISYIGHKSKSFSQVQLALGDEAVFNANLDEDSQLLSEVTVRGRAVNNGQGASTNFALEEIQNAPTVNRYIYDVAKLSPLVNVSKYGGISIAGTNNRYNSFQIDGVINNDVFGLTSSGLNGAQASGNPLSMDAIDQVQVVASPFDVRQSGFTGGAINVTTKSGTNDFTATAFGYYTDENMYSRHNQVSDRKDKLKDQATKTYGFTAGGPIIKDKLFFFASAEQKERQYPATYYAGMDDYFMTPELAQAMIDKYYEYTGIREGYGRNDIETKSLSLMGRLDWNINAKHHLTFRYQFNRANNQSYSGSRYTYYFHNSGQNLKNHNHSFVLELNSELAKNVHNELRASVNLVRDKRAVDYEAPSVYITAGGLYDVATGVETGTNYKTSMGPYYAAGINFFDQNIWTVEDNLSFYLGNHTLTLGTHNEFYKIENAYYTYAFGQYNYRSFTDFFNDNPYQFTWNYADTDITGDSKWAAPLKAGQLGFYVQDKWNVNTRFQLTGGLRIDAPIFFNSPSWNSEFNTLPLAIENDVVVGRRPKTSLMVSPRLGFRYFLDDNHASLLRGGVGIFNGRAPFVWLENAWANTGIEKKGTTITDGVPKFGDYKLDTPAAAASAAGKASLPDINTVSRDFKFPQVFRANLALEQRLPGDVKMTLEGLFSRSFNNIWLQNLAISDEGTTVFAVPGYANSAVPYYASDPASYKTIINLTNTDKGYSYSLSSKLEKSFDFGLDLMASYTFGHSYSVNEGTSSQAISNWAGYISTDPNKEVLSRSIFDIPHRVMAQASYNSKRYGNGRWQSHVSLTYNGVSGMHYSLVMNESTSPTFNGDYSPSSTANQLLYIPTDAELEAMQFTGSADRKAFKKWILADDYAKDHRGQFAERNSNAAPWENQFDLHFAQDFYYLKNRGSKIQIVFDIINVANLLNKDWGTTYSSYTSRNILTVSDVKTDEAGNKYGVYSFTGQEPEVTDIASRWHMQLGCRVTF